jgi:hypothetical protein
MKKKVQKILMLIVLALFPMLAAGTLYAADYDVGNSSTGSGSTNNATVTVVRALNVVITNDADINNDVTLDANTGANSADKNTGDGSVVSGNIDGTVGVKNQANVADVSPLLSMASSAPVVNISVSNHQTGANSTNTASFGPVSNTRDISVCNYLDVDNTFLADATTGGNQADKNTGNGSVKSGDISFNVAFATVGNLVNTVLGNNGGNEEGGGNAAAEVSPFQGVSAAEVAAATLPVAGPGDLAWMLILSAIATVFVVELLNRGELTRLVAKLGK